MNTSEIAHQIHSYICDHILSGQNEGLTNSTPLLELGILDSFGLFRLVAALNDLYSIEIRPEEIVGHDFKDIESIAALVAQHCEVSSHTGDSSNTKIPEGVVCFEESSCAQVFIIFTGLGALGLRGRMPGGVEGDKPEFFKWARLENRNIILLHDASGQSYRQGVSSELPTTAAICEWLQQWILKRLHIKDVYVIGISAGGPIAMVVGKCLKAKTVWAFAPRTAHGYIVRDTQQELCRFLENATGKTFQELEQGITAIDEQKIDDQVTPEIIDAYYSSFKDPKKLLDLEQLTTTVEALSTGNGVTEHRLYYVARDECDSRMVESLAKCPDVTVIPVPPDDEEPPKWAFSRWVHPIDWAQRDHLVVNLLHQRNEIGHLFPPFQPTASETGRPPEQKSLSARS